MIRCLLVDDDADIRESLQAYLRGYGFDTTAVADAAALRRTLSSSPFDVVVLDLMLPDANGLDLCAWLRKHSSAAIVMLTALGDPISRVLGLEMGADDYLAKPFEPRELVARLHAVLRRTRRAPGSPPGHGVDAVQSLSFAGWRFDRVARQLHTPEQVVVPLSAAEFRLLSAFVQHAGKVLSRDRLIELTRTPGVDVNGRSVDLAVSRLRGKLGDSPREPQLLRTVRNEGYLFTAQVVS